MFSWGLGLLLLRVGSGGLPQRRAAAAAGHAAAAAAARPAAGAATTTASGILSVHANKGDIGRVGCDV